MSANAAGFVPSAVDIVGDPDAIRALPLKRELRRIVQDQNATIACHEPVARRLEVTRQNIGFVDPFIGEKR
jgi:hypothetical protein